jgi:hypothetical protein
MARRLRPVSRRELMVRLKALGFSGPYTGGRHQFMVRGSVRLVLPNPHRGEVGVDLLIPPHAGASQHGGPGKRFLGKLPSMVGQREHEDIKRILRQAGIEEEEWLE